MRFALLLLAALSCALNGQTMAQSAPAAQTPNTATFCEQSIKYEPGPLDATVPKSFGTFQGVWVGQWSPGGLCSVLIVEKVDSNGSAWVIYAWGSQIRFDIKPGYDRSSAKITDKLRFVRGKAAQYSYELVGPNELSASYAKGYDIAHATFTRR
jgi:hypothetical protein